jgi:N-acylneuraminate cytidylyltransferase
MVLNTEEILCLLEMIRLGFCWNGFSVSIICVEKHESAMRDNTVLAVVMARGGSKRVPRKNVRLFLGRPMVAWPVAHAVGSGLFSHIIISTDDWEIADAAIVAGAVIHGLRPASFSDDHARTADVLRYELECFKKRESALPDLCCCLYGTSALAVPNILHQGRDALQKRNAEFLMAVIPYGHPIERALCFDDAGLVQYRQPEFVLTRTQDIQPSYHDSGLLYWFRPEAFFRYGGDSFAPLRKTAIVLSPRQAVDIDTEEDWELAEIIAGRLNCGGR